jgi:hypothetical protein
MVLIFMIIHPVFAQEEYKIRLKSREFIPEAVLNINKINSSNRNLIIQFNEPLNRDIIVSLINNGIKINGQVSSHALSVYTDNRNMLSSIEGIRWAGAMEPRDRISSRVYDMGEELYLVVNFHNSEIPINYYDIITDAGGIVLHQNYPGDNDLVIKISKAYVDKIAALDAAAYIYPASERLIRGEQVYKCPGPLGEFGLIPLYVSQGNGWDGPGLGSANLKYHFINGTPDVTGEEAEVTAALNTWSNYVQINWSAAGGPAQNKSFDISWGAGDHGCGFPFTGPGGVLAHCFYPDDTNSEPRAGDMHFDEDELWRIGSDIDVYTVALHEAGHGLGLNHSDDPNAIMYPYYDGPVADLRTDDISGIRSMYAIRNTPKTSPPSFNPVSGSYSSPLEVTLNYGSGSTAQNTKIFYTLNGSEPTRNSYEFTPGSYILLRYSGVVKARAFREGYSPSDIVSSGYLLQQSNLTVLNPVITPNGGNYSNNVQVSISCPTELAVIRYTTDGSEPGPSSFAYSSPLTLNSNTTLKVKAFRTNYNPSQTVTALFNISSQVPPPSVFPQPGIYSQPVSVYLSTPLTGAKIYYTTNGTTPTASSNLYSSPVVISQTTQLKAITIYNGMNSPVFEGWYNMGTTATTPQIIPAGGVFTGSVQVSMSTTTPGGVIRYTRNGAEPTAYSDIYNSPFNLGVGNHIVKAKTFHQSFGPSSTSSVSFIVYDPSTTQTATPVIKPFSTQTFTSPIPVSITCATEGALIRYTVGFDQLPADPQPTGGGSITYNGPFTIGVTGQNIFIKVRAFKDGLTSSNIVQTGMLSIVSPAGVVAAPVITPNGGVFHNNVQVTLSTSTQFAQILYTRDGSEPNSYLPIQSPTFIYNSPVTLNRSTHLKAKGTRTQFTDSNVSGAEFILKCGNPEITPAGGVFTDSVSIAVTTITTNAQLRYTLDGSEPGLSSALYSGPLKLYPGSYVLKVKAFRTNFEDSETVIAQIEVNETASAPVIISHPVSQVVYEGETAVFSIEAAGTPAPEVQWLRNSVALPGEISDSLVLENVQPGDAAEYSARVYNSAGTVYSNSAALTVNSPTSAGEYRLAGIPEVYEMKGSYPNPFNPSTRISFGIPVESKIVLKVYSMTGELVEVLLNDIRPAGYYEKIWDAAGYASGVYLLSVTTESLSGERSFSNISKLILLK